MTRYVLFDELTPDQRRALLAPVIPDRVRDTLTQGGHDGTEGERHERLTDRAA